MKHNPPLMTEIVEKVEVILALFQFEVPLIQSIGSDFVVIQSFEVSYILNTLY